MRPAATAAINALDTWAATGCTLAHSTWSAIARIVRVTSLVRFAAAECTSVQSTPRSASATSSASLSKSPSSTWAGSPGDERNNCLRAASCSFGVGQIGCAGESAPGRRAGFSALSAAAIALALALHFVVVTMRAARCTGLPLSAAAIGTQYCRAYDLVGRLQPRPGELASLLDRGACRADGERG